MITNNFLLKAVPIVTFIIGFLSFVTLSIYYNVFFLNSPYDVPLILNVSVMVGDSILLPVINFKIFNLYFNILGKRKPDSKLSIWIAFSLVFSVIMNIYTHNSWINDKFTDFVGFQQGELSIIGYWHLFFSIIEFVILLIYPFLWYHTISLGNKAAIIYSKKIWIYFFLFTTLGIFDMLNKYIYVYTCTFYQTIKNEGFPFTTSILSIILLIFMILIEQRHKDKRSLENT